MRGPGVLLASIYFLGITASTSAQTETGSFVLAGLVRDASSAPVAGAVVTARNAMTGFRQSAISSGTGGYRIESLPAGRYDVTAERSGYGTALASGVAVRETDSVTVDFTLKPVAEGPPQEISVVAIPAEGTKPQLRGALRVRHAGYGL